MVNEWNLINPPSEINILERRIRGLRANDIIVDDVQDLSQFIPTDLSKLSKGIVSEKSDNPPSDNSTRVQEQRASGSDSKEYNGGEWCPPENISTF